MSPLCGRGERGRGVEKVRVKGGGGGRKEVVHFCGGKKKRLPAHSEKSPVARWRVYGNVVLCFPTR